MKKLILLPALLASLGAAPAMAQDAGDPDRGERSFRKCQACHQVGEDAVSRAGPHLNDILGRQAGVLEDFNYSPAMVTAGEEGLVWDEEDIDAFIENPRAHVPGTKMAFAGIRNEGERADLIAYLATFSDEEDAEGEEAAEEAS